MAAYCIHRVLRRSEHLDVPHARNPYASTTKTRHGVVENPQINGTSPNIGRMRSLKDKAKKKTKRALYIDSSDDDEVGLSSYEAALKELNESPPSIPPSSSTMPGLGHQVSQTNHRGSARHGRGDCKSQGRDQGAREKEGVLEHWQRAARTCRGRRISNSWKRMMSWLGRQIPGAAAITKRTSRGKLGTLISARRLLHS